MTRVRKEVIARALRFEGYRAMADGRTTFAEATGINPAPWNGSYLTAVFEGLTEPKLTYPMSALTHYARKNRLFRRPKEGDVVFYADGRVGLVLHADNWRRDGSITAIEGETDNPAPRAGTARNGVWQHTRYRTDIMFFARPEYKHRKDVTAPVDEFGIRVSNLSYGKRNARIERLQSALAQVTDAREFNRGHFDNRTRSAYADWQRQCGVPVADGTVDETTLRMLSERTGLFTVKE